MFGFNDFSVSLGFLLTLLASLFCVVFGAVKWNRGVEEKQGDFREEIQWEREEIELIEKLP